MKATTDAGQGLRRWMALLACLFVVAAAEGQVRQIPGTAASRGGLGTFSSGRGNVGNKGSG